MTALGCFSLAALLHGVGGADPTIMNPAFTFSQLPMPATGTRRMETRFSTCSDHTFVIDKSGSFIAYSSVAGEATFAFNIKNAVYEVADHGPTGMLIHPNFPATPSIFIFYTADPTNKWDDSCTMAPDADGFTYCDTVQRLQRFDLTVTMEGDRCTNFALAGSQVLIQDWCSTSSSHGNGNIEWYDGANMILTSGDGAQPSQTDYGQRAGDVCYDAVKKLPQGRFRSQRTDGFLQGKLILIKAASLLKNVGLVKSTDYSIVATGLRQPYVNTVNPWTLDVLIGDVGSKQWEEVNLLTRVEMTTPSLWPLNFGWPCLEGRSSQANPTKGDFDWLRNTCDASKGELCDLCSDIFPCASGLGTAGCSDSYRPPSFQFRETIDRDDKLLCQASTHAIVGLTWIVGSDFSPQAAATLPYALVGSDYGSGCIFYWDVDPGTKRVKFEDGASVLATNHEEGLYLTRGRGGYLYASKSAFAEKDTLWQFGLVGGVRNNTADPPTALMETSLLDVASNTYKTINCRGGCAIMAGGTIKFDGDDSTAGGAPIATYKLNYGDGTGSVRGTATTFYKKYAAVGVFKPALIVADTNGLTDQDVVSINVRTKAVTITTTPASGTWKLGDVISYELNNLVATDVKTVRWDSTVTHCRPNGCTGGIDCHTHTNGVNAGGTLLAGKLAPPGHAMPSSMTITAAVTPTTGSIFTVEVETTALNYIAKVQAGVGTAVYAGWPVDVVDVKTCFSPCQVPYMAKISSELSESDVLYRGGKIYGFSYWDVVTPGVAGSKKQATGTVPITVNNMILTAKYTKIDAATDTINKGPALVGAGAYYGIIEVKWTVPPAGSYDWTLVWVTAADGTDRSSATRATNRELVVNVPLASKTYTVRLAGYNSATRTKSVLGKLLYITSSADSSKTCYDQSAPYGPAPFDVPGMIELEKFDMGGEGTAYHDFTVGNSGGAAFRSGLDVDIMTGGSGGYAVTQATGGEWLQYTVTVAATAKYKFTVYLASTTNTVKTIYVMMDATRCNKAEALVVCQQSGSTGGAAAFAAYTTAAVALSEGEHTLTLCIATSGLNLDRMVIVAA